jgi:hypothetical protein
MSATLGSISTVTVDSTDSDTLRSKQQNKQAVPEELDFGQYSEWKDLSRRTLLPPTETSRTKGWLTGRPLSIRQPEINRRSAVIAKLRTYWPNSMLECQQSNLDSRSL